MPEPGAAIKALLEADASVTAIVGTRIYPNIIPEDQGFPAISYAQVSQEVLETQDGPIYEGNYVFELNIFSPDHLEVINLSAACQAALDWKTGTHGGVDVERVFKVDQSSAAWEDLKEYYHVVQDYKLRLTG